MAAWWWRWFFELLLVAATCGWRSRRIHTPKRRGRKNGRDADVVKTSARRRPCGRYLQTFFQVSRRAQLSTAQTPSSGNLKHFCKRHLTIPVCKRRLFSHGTWLDHLKCSASSIPERKRISFSVFYDVTNTDRLESHKRSTSTSNKDAAAAASADFFFQNDRSFSRMWSVTLKKRENRMHFVVKRKEGQVRDHRKFFCFKDPIGLSEIKKYSNNAELHTLILWSTL